MNEAAANLSRPGVSSDACSDIFMKAAQGDPLGDRLASAALTHDKDERTLLASLLTRLWSVVRLAGGEMRDKKYGQRDLRGVVKSETNLRLCNRLDRMD